MKGTVFDVTGNSSYAPGASYHGILPSPLSGICHMLTDGSVFAGKDASRGLAQSSLKPEDARPDWEDLTDEQKKVLNDWFTFFSKRYNIVGKVEGATNTGSNL